jgi:hypothetical protein
VIKAGRDTIGMPSETVVLHRVAADTAGEIDSTRTASDGSFAFDLPSVPNSFTSDDVYIASVRYQGVLYFGLPIAEAFQLDSAYLIPVHDTTVAPAQGFALPLRVRYLMLDASGDSWVVTDGFQIENPGQTTLVAPDGGYVWSYPLPPGATDLEVGGGDTPPGTVDIVDGSLRISAPISPGDQQYMIRYRLTERRLDVSLPGPVAQVELLIREPAPELTVEGLMASDPVEIDPGSTYRRFVAVNVEGARVRVLPGAGSRPFNLAWIAVALALVLTSTTFWIARQPAPAAAAGEPSALLPVELRERLLLEVATLDESLETTRPSGADREQALERRRGLLEQIRHTG